MDEYESEQSGVSRNPAVKQTSWPKTLGIVAMIFGVLGCMNSLMTILGGCFPEFFAKISQLPTGFYHKWQPFLLISGFGILFLGGLLFFGGLFLTLRKRSASMMLNLWAVLKVVLGLVSAYFGYQMQQEQIPLMLKAQKETMESAGAAAAAGAEDMMGMISSITEIASTVGMVLGLLWLMVLPAVMLIWFIRPKIRREMAEW
ncbi:MAG: hypothetical protein GXP30_06545 [Verrucomicrobia bacterium]|nr:hypothetical protein [Verrucomicrobiota bacterium]